MFCSFGCAVVQAAPACVTCGAKVLGRGHERARRDLLLARLLLGAAVSAP